MRLYKPAAAQTILRLHHHACGNELKLEETIEVTLVNPGCTDSVACNYDADANYDEFVSTGVLRSKCLRMYRSRGVQLRRGERVRRRLL